MSVNDSITIIKNLFNITYVRNTGVAWSFLSGKTLLIVIVSLLIIMGVIYYIYKNKPKTRLETLGYSLVLGGAFGNFIDRIIYGYVIDFFDFNLFGYDYPIFNLADSFIFIGVVIIIIQTWRYKDGN